MEAPLPHQAALAGAPSPSPSLSPPPAPSSPAHPPAPPAKTAVVTGSPMSCRRRDFSTAQLKLMRRTLARACSDAEFDEFIAAASQWGLDPLRRQITPLVLNAGDPDRRRLLPWATIDGLRVIAARQGDYRPMETAPLIEFDASKIDPDRNPLGIVRAEVRVWKHRDGAWFPVAGEAWWDEYAPLREEKGDGRGADSAEPRLRVEANWARMGRVLIAKCAEAQALRRGWPDVLSGLYGEEELHGVRSAEQTASERLAESLAAANSASEARLWLSFDPNEGLIAVQRRDLARMAMEFLEAASTPSAIQSFLERNRGSLSLFWEEAPHEALALKAFAERRLAALAAAPDCPPTEAPAQAVADRRPARDPKPPARRGKARRGRGRGRQ